MLLNMRKFILIGPVSLALLSVFVGSSAVLLRFIISGPFKFILPVSSPVNAECIVAVSFLLLTLVRSLPRTGTSLQRSGGYSRATLVPLGIIVLVTLTAYLRALDQPFLFDDYGHVSMLSHLSVHDILARFYSPQPDIFFRPLGFLWYYLDFHWAGFNPFLWHISNLLIHVANCLLVYVLVRQLAFETVSSTFAGIIFSIHGTRAETVAWTDARFDLLSTFFTLLALVSFEKYVAGTKRIFFVAGLLFTALAILSKEAAFCIPLVLLVLAILHTGVERRRILNTVVATFVISSTAFVYRLLMIGGMGGYQTAGHPNVLHFNPVRIVKALLWRLWGFAFFPVNWWGDSNLWIKVSLAGFVLMLLLIAFWKRLDTKRLVAALLLTIAASVPVQHLVILNAGLTGARVYYLPVLGVALLWATIAETYAPSRYALFAIVVTVVFFNVVALEHNLSIWTDVARTAQSVCRTFGRQIAALPGSVVVSGLPYQERGVYFLANGFPNASK